MYHFVNFSDYNNTLNSTFVEITKTVYIFRNTKKPEKKQKQKVHKMVHLAS